MVAGTLIGIKWKGKWTHDSLIAAGWTFLIGLPLGVLLFGSLFSLELWLFIIIFILMLANLDDALIQTCNFLQYGVDGEVEPYEQ
jgi:hypothetical protein